MRGLPLLLCLLGFAPSAWSSDACSTRAVRTAADVTVSDGSAFRTESYFHSKEAAAIRHIRDEDRLIAVEGPVAWARRGDKSQTGTGFYRRFALGHQFHAFLLYFDDIVDKPRETEVLEFHGKLRGARTGDNPYGGKVHLVEGNNPGRPAGLLFESAEDTTISATFADWRRTGEHDIPYRIDIDDGERIFVYRYSDVELTGSTPLWYFESVEAPAIDEVLIYRLHRKLLAAHCLGDADLMADLSSESILTASRGELHRSTNGSLRERFSGLFERLEYTGYHDISVPVIKVAEGSDLGWIGVNVRAVGADKKTGESFDHQWAWLMVVERIDGQWLHAGNASNRAN